VWAQTPIGCGETLQNREINPATEAETYSFTANAGERVAITTWQNVGVVMQPVATLTGPSGAVALNGSLNPCTGNCVSATLPADGTYTIRVTDSGQNQTGLYHLTLEPLSQTFDGAQNGGATPTCQRGNDGTQPLACGLTTTGSIDLVGESDTFSFDAAAGEVVALTLWPASAGVPNVLYQLFGPTGTQVTLNGSLALCAGNCISGVLPNDGTYTLIVWDNQLNQTGAYYVTLEPLSATFNGLSNGPPTPVCQRGAEGTQVLTCGLDQAFQIDTIADSDTFVFQARAGEALSITAWIPAAGAGPLPAMRLYGPTGAQVPINGGTGNCTSGVCLTGSLPSDGTYTVVVWDFGLNNTGPYQLSLDSISGTFNGVSNGPPSPVCQHQTEGTQPIRCGETLSRSIANIADADAYTFDAQAGDAVFITVGGNPAIVNPTLLLFGPGGGRIQVNGTLDYCAAGLCQTGALPSDGRYTFIVWDSSLNNAGDYDVTLESISGGFNDLPNGPPAPTCQRGADGTQPLAIGDPATPANIASFAESDSFSFQGTMGQSLILAKWSTAAPAINPSLKLYAPGGIPVTLNGSLNYCTTNLCATPALSATGTYTAMIWDGSLNQTGSYRFGVFADDGDGVAVASDRCPFFAQSGGTLDTDADLRGDECECGDANGDGRNDVSDLVSANVRIFDPAPPLPLCGPGVASPCNLCDANHDNQCNVSDIVGINADIFSVGSTATCARQPAIGP
jgi:hypothetical protein